LPLCVENGALHPCALKLCKMVLFIIVPLKCAKHSSSLLCPYVWKMVHFILVL